MVYPRLPFQARSETSWRASMQMDRPVVESLRTRVYDYLRDNGPATDRQIQAGLDMDGSTERPRRIELFNAGLVVNHGTVRQDNGRTATVWRVSR